MIQPIHLYGSDKLELVSEEIGISHFTQKQADDLINDMFDTMNRANGVGLSAIQMGLPVRIFVIDFMKPYKFREAYINPEVIELKGIPEKDIEGCLSIPGVSGSVERYPEIDVTYYNQKRERKEATLKGFEARIFQHELDHLNGVLFIDKLEKLWKSMIELQLANIKNRTNLKHVKYSIV